MVAVQGWGGVRLAAVYVLLWCVASCCGVCLAVVCGAVVGLAGVCLAVV